MQNKNQELMDIIYNCVSYLNTEVQKSYPLLNDKTLSDIMDYLVTECHYQYQMAELPENKYSRGYRLNKLAQTVNHKVWDYIIIKSGGQNENR